ncbi:PocR ligand-binding domain-containing protein [Fictibacillus sp. WQ 8-8]|uniref:sensor histidine kinase n=1 Tax=Fictibacillus sp. WQ 8-8 TaxID=2938788 RepID=UPI002108EEF4|nr:PocR ligand-binding domain-containing protein [Fictibacillus sp. WQ 8-8]MCQ6265900.1 PocR ligand-binding domain-containing protein [Fictibacillus sp. WQ 8-8]
MKKLLDLVDVSVLQEIQNKFADATCVAVLICDETGVPITKASNFTSFCTYVRSSVEGLRRCILSDENVGKLAAGQQRPVLHRCHAGLVDFAAPIILRGRYIGAILCGQILMTDEELSSIVDMQMDITELSLDTEELENYFKQLSFKKKKQIEAIAELLFVTANHIVKICDAYLTKKELSKKSEKLIKELQRRSRLEKDLKETELKFLQSQINPHFLFNTLNTISRIAYMENAQETQQVTYLLAKILRYSLKNNEQYVTLEEEIEHVRNYLLIQQTRFRHKINFQLEVEQDLHLKQIPIFCIQPIIENSIVHGFEPSGEPIHISLHAYQEGNKMMITIFDDGIGIREENLSLPSKKLVQTTGIGLENVNKRLKHGYGPAWGITKIRRRERKGTEVHIEIPIS